MKIRAALWMAIAGCSGSNSPGAPSTVKHAEPTAEPSSDAPRAEVAAGDRAGTPVADEAEFEVGVHRVRLRVRESGCSLVTTTAGAAPQEVALELQPPCYILPWNVTPAPTTHAKAHSDAVAVGDKGEPMAYRYPSAGDATGIAIIGDPVSDELWRDQGDTPEQLRARKQTMHCASRLQGVVLTSDGARLSRSWISKRGGAEPRLLCTEGGLDEKDYWLLVHDAQAQDAPAVDDTQPLPEPRRKKAPR